MSSKDTCGNVKDLKYRTQQFELNNQGIKQAKQVLLILAADGVLMYQYFALIISRWCHHFQFVLSRYESVSQKPSLNQGARTSRTVWVVEPITNEKFCTLIFFFGLKKKRNINNRYRGIKKIFGSPLAFGGFPKLYNSTLHDVQTMFLSRRRLSLTYDLTHQETSYLPTVCRVILVVFCKIGFESRTKNTDQGKSCLVSKMSCLRQELDRNISHAH